MPSGHRSKDIAQAIEDNEQIVHKYYSTTSCDYNYTI